MVSRAMLFVAALILHVTPADAPKADAANTAPCATAPKGMVCIPGGPAVVGSDDVPNEKPKRTVQISTFYVDLKEATNADYKACVDAGVCPKAKTLGAPEAPALPLDFEQAEKYCTWTGKRLPSEWEWEKAARGTDGELTPWGKDAADCDKGAFKDCHPKGCTGTGGDKACADVEGKAYPAGRFGLESIGTNYEWTTSWIGILGHRKMTDEEKAALPPDPSGQPLPTTTAISRGDKDTCTDCEGVDPRGPCDGTVPCADGGSKKIVRGGGWYLPKIEAHASHRHGETLASTSQRTAVRCATSGTVLFKFPAKIATEKRAPPPALTPPTAEQLKQFADVTEDKLDTPTCEKQGRAFLDCRDPISYIKSNEPRQQVWRPYIENLGGGYTGVGIDQSYTFVAAAHSDWAWLFDYDPTVVRLHWILRAVILKSANRGEFVDHFRPAKQDEVLKILDEEYKDNPELKAYREIYKVTRSGLLKYYEDQLKGIGNDPTFGWLATDDNYTYIRTMYQQGRMRAFKGNMLDKNTMQGIGAAAKKMGVTIKIYYPSNAPECWPFTKEYKANVLGLPFDAGSIVLQTVSGLPPGYQHQTGHWHYNVQSGLQQQELIGRKGIILAKQLIEFRNKTQDSDLTISGLAAAEP